MLNLLVMPSSPALAAELSPADGASRALLAAARQLVVEFAEASRLGEEAAEIEVDIVGSRDPRWHTNLSGSLQARGAPSVELGAGN